MNIKSLGIQNLNVGIIVLIIQLFMFISADLFFLDYAQQVREILIIYFILYLMVWVTLGGRPVGIDRKETFYSFLLGFFLTSAVLLIVFLPQAHTAALTEVMPQASIASAMGFGLLHAFIKAYIEEDVFRVALPRYFGDIISNILFGIFHLSVLMTIAGLSLLQAILPVCLLVVLGFIWAYIFRNNFGKMAAVGSHFAWNLFAYGILSVIILGGVT